MSLKSTEKSNWTPLVENVIYNDSTFNIELGLLAFKIKTKFIICLIISFHFKGSMNDLLETWLFIFWCIYAICAFFIKKLSMQFSPKLF